MSQPRAATDDDALVLAVGCAFELEAAQPLAAVVQVAPRADPRVHMRREQWDTDADHHGYVDIYGNRCERFLIGRGTSRIAYQAELLLTEAADVIEPTLQAGRPALPDAA